MFHRAVGSVNFVAVDFNLPNSNTPIFEYRRHGIYNSKSTGYLQKTPLNSRNLWLKSMYSMWLCVKKLFIKKTSADC